MDLAEMDENGNGNENEKMVVKKVTNVVAIGRRPCKHAR